MFKKRIFLSIFILGLAITLAGAGTWAALQDTETSTGNTMTSGTLNLQLSNEALDNYKDGGVTATWTSPANFKPGDIFSKELYYTNTGTVNVNHIYIYPHIDSYSGGTGGVNLADKIIITKVAGHFMESFMGYDFDFEGPNRVNIPFLGLQYRLGDRRPPLTLSEFCQANYVAYPTKIIEFLPLPVLVAGDNKDFSLIIEGQFDPAADNKYQGTTCTFSLRNVASQYSPTEGFELITDA